MILTRLIFARLLAVVLFLQGVGPAFLWGVWRPGGWFSACLAVTYTLLTGGIWRRKSWALPVAFAITLPQFVVWSSSWCSWRLLVLGSYGLCVEPADSFWNSRMIGYRSYGCSINMALGYNPQLLAQFPFVRQPDFLLINTWVAVLLVLLLIAVVADLYFAFFPPEPNHTLQRTATGLEATSDHHA